MTLTKFPIICEVESNVGVYSATSGWPEDHYNSPRIVSETLQVRERWKTWNWARYSTAKGILAGELSKKVLFDTTTIEWGPS